MEQPLVELKSVSKYFGSVIALKDVSFDVRPGEVHCQHHCHREGN